MNNVVQGVIGLTTAIKIQERGGYRVTVVADTLPSDPKSAKYTSHWAVSTLLYLLQYFILNDPRKGAQHVAGTNDERLRSKCLLLGFSIVICFNFLRDRTVPRNL